MQQKKAELVQSYVKAGKLPKAYTKEDFMLSQEPYELLYNLRENPFEHDRTLKMLQDAAQAVGFTSFVKTYDKYKLTLKKMTVDVDEYANMSAFEGQDVSLKTGNWICDEDGIYIPGSGYGGDMVACVHPILPIQRLVNIDSGIEKLVLSYRKGGRWRTTVADKKTLASSTGILDLANVGIAVNADNAKLLIKYLHDVENLNYEDIPERRSISRMGWIEDNQFSPYIKDVVFDAEINYKAYFDSIRQCGSYSRWIDLARSVRRESPIQPRILLAASFASVLVQPLGILPFFVHLWGGTGVGKTVGLMLAVSVWADPQKGRYWRTFDATAVGQEKSAGFLNSLPLVIDELQLISDKKSFDKMIYSLSEGVGRSRGSKTGGLQKIETWGNAILTTGEKPLTSLTSGGGAVNRVLDVECKDKFFKDPQGTANFLRRNYGFAGQEFVERLQDEGTERSEELYNKFYSKLIEKDTTEKQAMAGAAVLTADTLITEWLFEDNRALTIKEIEPFLQAQKEVDSNVRGYQRLCELVAANPMRFQADGNGGEVWGTINETTGEVAIIRGVFGDLMQNAGFDARALLSWMMDHHLCEFTFSASRNRSEPTKNKRINGVQLRCVIFTPKNLDEFDEFEYLGEESDLL